MSGLFPSPQGHQVTYFRLHGSVGERRFALASPNRRVPSATLRWAPAGVLPRLSAEAVPVPKVPLTSLQLPLLGHTCAATRVPVVRIHLCRCTHVAVVGGFLFSQFVQ